MDSIARSGRTILFVSHNTAVVQNLCTKAVYLARGRVVEVGPCHEVLASYVRSGNQAGEGPVLLDACRVPGVQPIIRHIEITDDAGRPTRMISAGQPLVIRIFYESATPLKNAMFGVFGRGMTGERLFHLQSLAMHGPLEELSTHGVATCRIPCLPLVPGRYLLSFNCSNVYAPGDLDYLDDAIALDVEATDFYGTGRLPPAPNGPFLIKGSWDFTDGAGDEMVLPKFEEAVTGLP